jgi:hypothetical protein
MEASKREEILTQIDELRCVLAPKERQLIRVHRGVICKTRAAIPALPSANRGNRVGHAIYG